MVVATEKAAVPVLHYVDPNWLRTIDGSPSGNIVVDVAKLVQSRMLIVANSGAGKSRALRSLLEETAGHVQQIVFDLEGEFVTLREIADVIIAGDGGDIPAHPDQARALCRRLMALRASCVINLYELKTADRRKYVRLFLEELMSLGREHWHPCVIVLDEAHTLCPERGVGEAESTDAVVTLCTQGRKRGYCAVLATQRLSKLHKDAAAECLNKLIGRTALDVDVKRAATELGMDRATAASLATLEPGEFYVYGPAIAPTVQRVRTADVRTSHPTADAPTATAPASVQSILAQLGDLPAIAAEDAQTVASLQQQIAQLRAAAKDVRPSAEAVHDALQRGGEVAKHLIGERVRMFAHSLQQEIDRIYRYTESLRLADITESERSMSWGSFIAAQGESPEVPYSSIRQAAQAGLMEEVRVPMSAELAAILDSEISQPGTVQPLEQARGELRAFVRSEYDVKDEHGLGRTPRRMLGALVELRDLGITLPSRRQLALWIGVSHDTGTFRNNLGALRKVGAIEDGPEQSLQLTEKGAAFATTSITPIRSRSQLHQIWFEKVGKSPSLMLQHLVRCYPDKVSRVELAATLGVSHDTGTFRNNLGTLRTLGLLEDVDRQHVRATALLFPKGLPR